MIDEYGEGLNPDLLYYYGVDLRDVVNGDIAPLFVISLIERLPEGSKTQALMQDSKYWRSFMDINPDYYVLAGIFNAVNDNTRARGNFKKPPKFEPWPVPQLIVDKAKKKESDRPKTVKDLYARIMRKK